VGHDIHLDHGGHEAGHHGQSGRWIPFLSLRFYTYFFAGLGATGLLVHWLTTTPDNVTFWLALVIGLLSAFSVSTLIRILRTTGETSSGTTEQDVLGIEAKVLVAVRGSTPGRIRCMIRGEAIDYLAITDEPAPIEPGTTVIVIAMENGRAHVMSRSALFTEDPVRSQSS
jgi:hypothetical protein